MWGGGEGGEREGERGREGKVCGGEREGESGKEEKGEREGGRRERGREGMVCVGGERGRGGGEREGGKERRAKYQGVHYTLVRTPDQAIHCSHTHIPSGPSNTSPISKLRSLSFDHTLASFSLLHCVHTYEGERNKKVKDTEVEEHTHTTMGLVSESLGT